MTKLLGLIALLDIACAASAAWVGLGFYRSAQEQENAGLGLMSLALIALSAAVLAISLALIWLVRQPVLSRRTAIAALTIGLAPPATFTPFWLDAYRRSTTELTLACSNLSHDDPHAEVAIFTTFYTYFALLHPWIAHEPDTRYRLIDSSGREKVFRLRCPRSERCTVIGATETELRAAAREMLPPCPPR